MGCRVKRVIVVPFLRIMGEEMVHDCWIVVDFPVYPVLGDILDRLIGERPRNEAAQPIFVAAEKKTYLEGYDCGHLSE